jgi:hypothetical protein
MPGVPAVPNPCMRPSDRRIRTSGTTVFKEATLPHSLTRSASSALPVALALAFVGLSAATVLVSAGLVRATSAANRSASESSFEALLSAWADRCGIRAGWAAGLSRTEHLSARSDFALARAVASTMLEGSSPDYGKSTQSDKTCMMLRWRMSSSAVWFALGPTLAWA